MNVTKMFIKMIVLFYLIDRKLDVLENMEGHFFVIILISQPVKPMTVNQSKNTVRLVNLTQRNFINNLS